MKVLVNKNDWFVRATIPYPDINDKGVWRDNFNKTPRIPATVPGGVHLDLFNAGLIENPYFDQNSIKCEWTENRWWIYETTLNVELNKSKKIFLLFEGLDYSAQIYVNGKMVCEHENMFTPAKIDITDIATKETKVLVVFGYVPREMGQFGLTSMSSTQKSRFGYSWDFATRLVNIGIWQDVYLEYVNDIELDDAKIITDVVDSVGEIETEFHFLGKSRSKVNIQLISPDGQVIDEDNIDFSMCVRKRFEVKNPQLWYPNGMGEHPLYTVKISCDDVCASYRTGIRSLRYISNEGAPSEAMPFTILINGERVQIKGMNKVPMDHLYGNVDYANYEWHVRAMVNENANMVRVWGGGIIETEVFYDLCDENGILVWQDFIQSSSHTDHFPGKDPVFLGKLRDASTHAVKVKRNHVSLTFWCGGNELLEETGRITKYSDETNTPATYKDANIAMLKDIVNSFDSTRLFLPTTPSGPVYYIQMENPNNYDVHGPWEYLGPHEEYEQFNKLKILLNGEVGLPSINEDTSLFLSGLDREGDNYWKNYRHHGGYWFQSYERDIESFGEFDSLAEYALYGQWLQSEALRYVLESEQRLGNKCAGTQFWCLNEPWPSADNNTFMDYFGRPKMVYYWIKDAFAECGASLKHNSMVQPNVFEGELHATPGNKQGEITVTYYTLEGIKLDSIMVNTSEIPKKISRDMSDAGDMYFVRIECNGVTKDHFFSKIEKFPYSPARNLKKVCVTATLSEPKYDGEFIRYTATVKNNDDTTALFVHPFDNKKGYAILADNSYFSLVPGEERTINLTLRKRLGLFFDPVDFAPEIIFKNLNQ